LSPQKDGFGKPLHEAALKRLETTGEGQNTRGPATQLRTTPHALSDLTATDGGRAADISSLVATRMAAAGETLETQGDSEANTIHAQCMIFSLDATSLPFVQAVRAAQRASRGGGCAAIGMSAGELQQMRLLTTIGARASHAAKLAE
jgi:hypothetical protein